MPAHTSGDDPLVPIVAALQAHGPITAGRLADLLGVPYPTLTPRLRRLEADGRAERLRDPATRQSTWHATGPATAPSSGAVGEPATDDRTPDSGDTPSADEKPTDNREPAEPVPERVPTNGQQQSPQPGPSEPTSSPAPSAPAGERRPKGSIAADLLAVVRADPDQAFKISQLSKALGGTSAGAIANAASKLVVSGELLLVCEKPATYQAA
jgi:hypothetical protein